MTKVTVAFHCYAHMCKKLRSCKTLMSYCDLLHISKCLKSVSFAVTEAGLPDVI